MLLDDVIFTTCMQAMPMEEVLFLIVSVHVSVCPSKTKNLQFSEHTLMMPHLQSYFSISRMRDRISDTTEIDETVGICVTVKPIRGYIYQFLKFISAHWVYLQGIWVYFIYEGHRVKVKGAEHAKHPYSRNEKLRSAITPLL